jgi:branched-chain amino acid transport system permease protein
VVGAFYAKIVGTVNVDSFTFQFSIIILCSVILGGMGNVWGAVLGAVAITWLSDNGLKWVGNEIGTNLVKYQFGLFGLILVVMMLFRPQGFIPAARSKQVKQAEQQVLATQEVGV